MKLPLIRTLAVPPARAPILRYGVALLSTVLALIPTLFLSDMAESRLVVVSLDAAGELALFFGRQTREFRNGTEIRPQRISVVRGGVRHTDIIRATRRVGNEKP